MMTQESGSWEKECDLSHDGIGRTIREVNVITEGGQIRPLLSVTLENYTINLVKYEKECWKVIEGLHNFYL